MVAGGNRQYLVFNRTKQLHRLLYLLHRRHGLAVAVGYTGLGCVVEDIAVEDAICVVIICHGIYTAADKLHIALAVSDM